MEFLLPNSIMNGDGNSPYPKPEEYNYWKARENRTFWIDWEIDECYDLIELSKIIIQMNIDEKDIPIEDLKPIRLMVHSYGGDLEQSLYFCDLVKSSRIPIITIACGVAMSAGFLIFISGAKKYVFPHTQLLVHSGSAGFQGTAEQIEEAQKNYKKQLESMKKYILENTNIPENVFNKNKTKDWYLSKDDIVNYSVADEIITDISIIL